MGKRLDLFLTEKCNIDSRTKAQKLIKEGFVLVNGKNVLKSSVEVFDEDIVEIVEHDDYVSRGAYKLIGAIEKFNLNFNNKIVLDVGASTGGFTQVSLKNGAKKVYALDVGEGQLDKKIKTDKRVVDLSKTDIRVVEKEKIKDVDIIIGDLSFISLTKVLPRINEMFGNEKEIVFLFKPQFECGKDIAKKYRGIIKNKQIHKNLLKNFENFAKILKFSLSNMTFSPIKGGDGNIEYLVYLNGKNESYDIEQLVEEAFRT